MRRWILASLMSLLIVLALLPVSAQAATVVEEGEYSQTRFGTDGKTIQWSLDSDGVLTFTGSGKLTGPSLFSHVDDLPWEREGTKDTIVKIVVGEGFTSIPPVIDQIGQIGVENNLSFAGLAGLREISLPNTLESIDATNSGGLFSNCTALKTVNIPSSLRELTGAVFNGCSSLTFNTLDLSGLTVLSGPVFEGCSSLTAVIAPAGTETFRNCTGLKTATIIGEDEWIGSECFSGCTALETVNLPQNLKGIWSNAFQNCASLEVLEFPQLLDRIEYQAFDGCTGLLTITFNGAPPSLNSYYGENHTLFGDCPAKVNYPAITAWQSVLEGNPEAIYGSRLTWSPIAASLPYAEGVLGNLNWEFSYQSGTLKITGTGEMVFDSHYDGIPVEGLETYGIPWDNYKGAITKVVIGDGVTSIGNAAFEGCENLTTVEYPSSLSSVGVRAFSGCTKLTEAVLPNGLAVIGADTYNGCSSLKHIEIPNSVTQISDRAFMDCTGLTSVAIPDSVKKILGAAFYHSGLETLTLGCNVEYIDGQAFCNTSLESVFIPKSVKTIWTGTFNTLTEVEFEGDLPYCGPGYTIHNALSVYYSSTNPAHEVTVHYPANNTTWAEAVAIDQTDWQDRIIWVPEQVGSYAVTYSANGGTGTPSQQIKLENVPLTLSSLYPSKSYTIRYNANGGSVTPASQNLTCTFISWNTASNGSGTSYAPGSKYTANASVTLYAQWENPVADGLAMPVRSGFDFIGWFTASDGGTQVTASTTVSGDMTVYAHWASAVTNVYNLGEETYSFSNYGDSDSPGGHCFGMSITSAAYYNNLLNIGRIGGNANTPLYSFRLSQIVKQPICFYQQQQGSASVNATVAGGSFYLGYGYNINLDWQEVVSYVRNHDYDGTGLLQIGFRNRSEGGHAINFIRYENVNGQDRLYAYDNNFPTQETYFYRDSSGRVRQAPVQTFEGTIDCIALRDVRTYFANVKNIDATHVVYMAKDAATIQGYTGSYMEGTSSGEEYMMYEIPADQDRVIIIPSRDNADFIYMDTEYSFGQITDETRGELKFATLNEGAVTEAPSFRIFEGLGKADFNLPTSLKEIRESAFEGIIATTVYVPDSCTSIGAYAFRNASVAQIRIPASCTIADTAFEGCASVEIFGTPGSPAEAFCSIHDNCTFTAE